MNFRILTSHNKSVPVVWKNNIHQGLMIKQPFRAQIDLAVEMSEFDDSSKSNGHIGSWNIGTFIRMKPPPRNKTKKLIGLRNHGKHKCTIFFL